ncbi:protein LATERAL BRANCHING OXIDOREDUCTASE 1-like [Typha latifolia]|uniref:protein LATERAL BRANCHING OXIDOREDUCTASE 1-like n=1 Tax=Typha latifolia TaxID=4733 RepID=UPI003C2F1AC7
MDLEVDPAFLQEPEHRPNDTVVEAGGIPLIDLSPLLHLPIPDADFGETAAIPEPLAAVLADVEAACREWGFFQVVNHGVAEEVVEKAAALARGFFGLEEEEKRRVRRDEVNPLGYYESEHTKNVRDWKEVFDFAVEEPMVIPDSAEPELGGLLQLYNQWPRCPIGFREACEEYAKAVTELAFKLLELIALTLNMPAKCLNNYFKDQTSFIRLNYYPPCPSPHLALGVGRHKDSGALTILQQDDVGGLEVKRRSDGKWIRVRPFPSAFVVNVGDIVQVWSNDRYESVEHRVVANSEKGRLSIPFFFNPAHYVTVKPLEELVDEEKHPSRYKEYSWGKFFRLRKISDFKKLEVENIQVHHFSKN